MLTEGNLPRESLHWYLVYTKPRQEKCALENLERQGYPCYLPLIPVEKICSGVLKIVNAPLFPRYLFVQLDKGNSAKSWAPIRSTKGVSHLVTFGAEPARVDDALIALLQTQEASAQDAPERLFRRGERVLLTETPFAGIEGIYQVADGERRVMVLIDMLSKQLKVGVTPDSLRKVG